MIYDASEEMILGSQPSQRSTNGMAGFPLAWTDQWTHFDPLTGCPYQTEEIAAYLKSCQEQYGPIEEPFLMHSLKLISTKTETSRKFWVWQVADQKNTQWFTVVGSGITPSGERRNIDRWIYAETNDDELTPEEFLDREFGTHP